MSTLLDKSVENSQVANLLIDQYKCYAASVHCAYYSVFQRSVHILRYQFGMTERDIDLDAAFGGTSKDSHKKTIAVVYDKIDKANERQKAVLFRREMGELKGKRTKADYSDEVIDKALSVAARDQSQRLQTLLNNVFPLS